MNLGGIKVSAVEIEKLLDQHPAVTEMAAVAVAPPEGGPGAVGHLLHYAPRSRHRDAQKGMAAKPVYRTQPPVSHL